MVFQPYDQNYKFLSNEGYIFSYLISKLARFERFMAIDNVFEKKLKFLKIVDFCYFRQFMLLNGVPSVPGLFQGLL